MFESTDMPIAPIHNSCLNCTSSPILSQRVSPSHCVSNCLPWARLPHAFVGFPAQNTDVDHVSGHELQNHHLWIETDKHTIAMRSGPAHENQLERLAMRLRRSVSIASMWRRV